MRLLPLLALLSVGGCDSTSPAGADLSMPGAAADLAGADLIGVVSDLAGADLRGLDLAGVAHPCSSVAQCRKFSVECAPGSCDCIALSSGEIDPVCPSGPLACFVDPCQLKTVACENNMCVIK